ncbi:Leucine-rich repeat protein kinase family protein [Forsythia ovata]|uniref:non-specific serine/threonine protein kinase n=1 Tax=Forsythia ovata TaxID=205694 RepID=A0ABD1T875_9LAMI
MAAAVAAAAAATTTTTTTFFFIHLVFTLLSLSSADDTAVMSKLLSSFSPTPSGWSSTTQFCTWTNVNCDNSKSFVTSINLISKSLSGTLPSELNQLSQLKSISLQRNSLSGTLPSFSNMSFLEEIYLDSNNFESIPPNFLLGLTNLQSFTIDDNYNLSPWEIPFYLTDSTNLVMFYASNASLNGVIPDFFSAFQNFQRLRLSYNNLTGSLPASFGGSEIQNLWLNNQKLGLSGTIEVLSSMSQLSQVWLHANAFTGPIPDLSNCTILFDLQLRDNQFTGLVPASLISLPKLVNITLQNNKLQGPMPEFGKGVKVELGNTNSFCKDTAGACDPQVTALLDVAGAIGFPISLADSWKGDDACQDWKFITCDLQKKNVNGLNLGKQKFSGTISPAFSNLTSLRNLLLNDNNLTGSIPNVLTTLPELQTLDVSNNNLSGPIPVFPASVKFSHDGNLFLGKNVSTGGGGVGGAPGSGSGSGSPNGSPLGTKKGSAVPAGVIIGVVLAVLVFVSVLLFVSYKCYVRKRLKRFGRIEGSEAGKETVKSSVTNGVNGFGGVPSELQSQSSGDHSEIPVSEGGNVVISIQVLREVTDNFSEENVLGRGGFGVVYKGELRDGTKIAVKRMESGAMGTKGMNEFRAEIAVLTKVRHRHLVALLGYCINGNERLLVYEYMPQGTLSQHLFEWQELSYQRLTWKQRVTIALDVARGVEYLHSLAQQSFIHRDLKPSNILLGDDMRAKVADFGLVRNAPDGNYSVETRLAGTFGYLAPEYAATGRVTTKVDVYAFGVVLMEIITGRKALDETVPDERSHLVTWFRRVLINQDNLRKAIDATLDPDEETYESICKVAELAGHCTGREPFQRPDMGHAVNILGPLVEQWKPSNHEEEEGNGIDLHTSLPEALLRWQSDEGTSTMFDDFSYTQTHTSIPAKPSGFAVTFSSMDGR